MLARVHSETTEPSRSQSQASLATSLTREVSDGEEVLITPLLSQPSFLREEDEPPPPAATGTTVACLAGAIIFLMLVPPFLLRRPSLGYPPACRKSAAMAVTTFPSGTSTVVVWSGMGHGEIILNDTHIFNISSRVWTKVPAHHHHRKEGDGAIGADAYPCPRWKAAVTETSNSEGMLVLGGANDHHSARKAETYLKDVWELELPALTWRGARSEVNDSGHGPVPRRAHSAVVTESSSGQAAVVFGGRESSGTLLNDVWIAELRWPVVNWRLLVPGGDPYSEPSGGGSSRLESSGMLSSSATPEGLEGPGPHLQEGSKKKKHAVRPVARKGHTAVLLSNVSMVVFGGRTETNYLNDLWILDLTSGKWKVVDIAPGSPLPPPRDHHGAAIGPSGHMIVYAGRGGPTFQASQPLGDLWAFDFESGRWSQVHQYGLKPLPRFLYSSVVHTRTAAGGAEAPALLVFGGETLQRCKLNDLWALDLARLRWEELSPNVFTKRRCDKLF